MNASLVNTAPKATEVPEQQAGEIKSDKKHKGGSIKRRRFWSNLVIYIILVIMSVIWLAPVVWLVLMSFSGDVGLIGFSRFIPSSWTFQNYVNLFTNKVNDGNGGLMDSLYVFFFKVTSSGKVILGSFIYTLIIAICSAIISTIFCLATSYAFSRLRFKGRQGMMKAILLLGMFPGFLGLIVLYQIFAMLGMTNADYPALQVITIVIVYSGGAGMGYYISKGFFDTISKQIDEAAMVDGASRFQIFYKITLPLSKPIIVYTILTSFMGPWAEYMASSYILRSSQNAAIGGPVTVAPQLQNMISDLNRRGTYFTTFCTAAVVIAIPTSLLFILLQKNYVSGVTGGAVKG